MEPVMLPSVNTQRRKQQALTRSAGLRQPSLKTKAAQLHSRRAFSSPVLRLEVQVQGAGRVGSSWASPGWQMVTFWLPLHAATPVCA